ncbi:MAG TPA: tyrosinase family protein [Polyangiales bacterium]|nr:tyrosinase family protein [Polyangiales bacterium]
MYIKDTPVDVGVEPNPDLGPMWVSQDIWVRAAPDPNYDPAPFPEAAPPWSPLAHENPEYRDPLYSVPNYIYVRVRNRGGSASSGTERLRVYFAKASTGLAWPAQWVDNVDSSSGTPILYGMEVTKPRKNAALATPAERDAYIQAILDVGTLPGFVFPDGKSYWHHQNFVHTLGSAGRHHTPAFLPWHREMVNRYEVMLQRSNPTVKLLYWDWTTDPENSLGFNFFSSSFMGASGRGTGGVSIGAPFSPAFDPPAVTRNLSTSVFPPADPDSNVLLNALYPAFRSDTELSPNHDSSHGYIGGGGNMSYTTTAAQDPFFFLLHTNVDRLWAQWQRDVAHVSRIDAATAYDGDAANANITTTMAPWNGATGLSPYTAADGYIVNKTSLDSSVVSPPIYDSAPLVIPALAPGEAVVIQIPWYPPNPADFPSFGADAGHFCLLARIETSTTSPYGMTTPEAADVNANTRNNNNIAWKNVTVVDNFAGAFKLTTILLRNPFEKALVEGGLRFADTAEFGSSFLDVGRITVNLGEELFKRWREGGGKAGPGIEINNDRTLQIFSPDTFISGLKIAPGEVFPIEIGFRVPKDYEPTPAPLKWDLIQTGSPDDAKAVVGGQRFEVDLSKLVLIPERAVWRYAERVESVEGWRSAGFDDKAWKTGKAELGFGDDPVTTIDAGDPDKRRIATYFRKTFQIDDPSLVRTLHLRLKANDGAVVYLNGREVHRTRVPAQSIGPQTLATEDLTGLARDVFYPAELPADLLRPGANVMAVEVHLASPRSQDLSFDLELYANPFQSGLDPAAAIATRPLARAGQEVVLGANALDPDGKIAGVEFWADGALIGTDNDAPFDAVWSGAKLGTHRTRIVAIDDQGRRVVRSTRVNVVENLAPAASVLAPAEHSVHSPGQPIVVSADASDADGKVARVEFRLHKSNRFEPAELVGVAEDAPYTIELTDLPPFDDYMLTAVAIDDEGAEGISVPVMFAVGSKLGKLASPLAGAPHHAADGSADAGAQSSGCSVNSAGSGSASLWLLAALGVMLARRRRRASSRSQR